MPEIFFEKISRSFFVFYLIIRAVAYKYMRIYLWSALRVRVFQVGD